MAPCGNVWITPPIAVLGVGAGVVRAQVGMEYTCCWTGGRIIPGSGRDTVCQKITLILIFTFHCYIKLLSYVLFSFKMEHNAMSSVFNVKMSLQLPRVKGKFWSISIHNPNVRERQHLVEHRPTSEPAANVNQTSHRNCLSAWCYVVTNFLNPFPIQTALDELEQQRCRLKCSVVFLQRIKTESTLTFRRILKNI